MRQLGRVARFRLLLLGVVWAAGTSGQAIAAEHGRRLHVANNGTDSAGCGAALDPCRSISQAIDNASPGDTIVVGPGRYGDLNGNGTLGEPGEESGAGLGMVTVNKAVTLVSSDGASATVLDARSVPGFSPAVIAVDGVVFGKPGRGFLLTGSTINGLTSGGFSVSNVVIAGNKAIGNGGAGLVISGNSNLLHDNFAGRNAAGGIVLFGAENEARDNVASGNSDGFSANGTGHVLRNNIATGNAAGISVSGTDMRVNGNTALGNTFAGIVVDGGTSASITKNNIYGNHAVPANGLSNCGIFNFSGNAIVAVDNFWGAASGPGADPADNGGAGSGCDVAGSSTIVVPFATREFR